MKAIVRYSSQGSVRVGEDFVLPPMDWRLEVYRRRMFVVGDGVSGVYYPGKEQVFFDGRTTGQVAMGCVTEAFIKAPCNTSLQDIIDKASMAMAAFWGQQGLSLHHPEKIGGTTLATADFWLKKQGERPLFTIATLGDCMALWETKRGTYGGTSNSVFAHDMEMNELQKKARETLLEKESNESIWAVFGPQLSDLRSKRVNAPLEPFGYGVLNGQPEYKEFLYVLNFDPRDLKYLLLTSDGLLPYYLTSEGEKAAQWFFEHYKSRGSLEGVMAVKRELEKAEPELHIAGGHAEASAVLIPMECVL